MDPFSRATCPQPPDRNWVYFQTLHSKNFEAHQENRYHQSAESYKECYGSVFNKMKSPMKNKIDAPPATLPMRHGGVTAVVVFYLTALVSTAQAIPDGLTAARDGSGVYGYKDTPKLPWCDWRVHDPDRPAPPRVDPGPALPPVPAPADATILFDGKGLDAWQPGTWTIENGEIVAGDGQLTSLAEFGNCQIHVEWLAPEDFHGPWHDRGNNGVMLMGLYEIQIFDSYNEKLYPDGQAAAIYGQTPPLVNVTRPPGQWQTFDIIFTAPVFDGGALKSPARVTMFHNGVLVHMEAPIHGETRHKLIPNYQNQARTGPLVLHGHNCPVRFRNIWVRRL